MAETPTLVPVAAADGHTFTTRWQRPAAEARATFVIGPALGVGARYYDPLARAFADAGVNAVVTELRGQDTSSLRASRTSDWGYEEAVRYDWPALLASVRAEAGTAPIVLLGHSMGGHLSALHLGRVAGNEPHVAGDPQIAGLVIVASGSTHFRGWPFPQNLGLLFATQLVALVSKTLGYYPGARFGFGGLQARQEMLDWARTSRNGRYELKGAEVDDEAALARVTTPTWAFTFAGDRYAPPGSTAILVGKLRSARVSMVHLGPADLPRECLHHFAWVRNPVPVVARILRETGF